MGRIQFLKWSKCFRSTRVSLENDDQSGRPATSVTIRNMESINQLVQDDRWGTINNVFKYFWDDIQQRLLYPLNWILYIDNAPCPRTLLIMSFLPKTCYHLHSCRFLFLLPRRSYSSKDPVLMSLSRSESQTIFNLLTENDFRARFQKLQESCSQCITGQGDHVEGKSVITLYILLILLQK